MGFIPKGVIYSCILISGLIFWLSNCEQSFADDKKDCNHTAKTQDDLNECSHKDGEEAKARLDDVYNKLMAKISPVGQARLKLAREAWTVYRAEDCEFESLGSSTGSIHPTIVNECYAYLTNEYAKLLERHLNCVEGDSSCGGQ